MTELTLVKFNELHVHVEKLIFASKKKLSGSPGKIRK
jgi:hypothetical protein